MLPSDRTIVRFEGVSFTYDHKRPILKEANFSVREGTKITIVGQNGAGKSTIFKLILGELKPVEGQIHREKGMTIGIARQVLRPLELELTVEEYFASAFHERPGDLERHIMRVLDAVNLVTDLSKKMSAFSGGQKARLLLAHALIREPDLLLLDEPTNNLDSEGIGHLIGFLMSYEKSVLVISHDAAFLNCFTQGVLYLDAHMNTVSQYLGDYHDAIEQIQAQIVREQQQNARMEKDIQDRKDKVNFFAHKGGKMRKLASKMREDIEDAEANKVEVRREDKAIPPFTIPAQEFPKPLVKITSVTVMKEGKPTKKKLELIVRRRSRILLEGPNGIGKTTLLESLARGTEKGAVLDPEAIVGYYRQDFSGLSMDKTVYEVLNAAMETPNHQMIFSTAARFQLSGDKVQTRVDALSEGQKGLLCFARFVLQEPSLLILDEPSNHINYRHLPVIAEALNAYEGGLILVTHDTEFLEKIRIDERVELG